MQEKFDEFIEEINNDIRQEKYMLLWQKYGKLISSAITGVIVLAAGIVFWNQHMSKKQIELSDTFLTAQNYMHQGKADEALAIFESMSVSETKVYGYLRDFGKAAIFLKSFDGKKHMEGQALYENMMKNTHLPKNVQDMARLLCAKTMMGAGQKATEIEETLAPLSKEESPWRFIALEMLGQMYFSAGNTQKAQEFFAQIARSTNVPEGIMMRAQLMVQVAANGGNAG